MRHLSLKATTTMTDQEQGTFEALVSAWAPDRVKDVIERHAFDETIAEWRGSGRQIPLLFEHGSKSVGAIDPFSMRATEEGLVVSGEVDRETDEGKQVWKMIKAGTISFSIGFMSESRPREGGGRILDLLEVSATATPTHPSARALSWKSSSIDPVLTKFFNHPAFSRPGGSATWSCPPELIGTSFDPEIATGEVKGLTRAAMDEEVRVQRKATNRTRAVKIASFQVK
jgi:HK97 family phage prohead protease